MKTREELKIDESPDDVSRSVGLFAPQALVQTGQLSSGSSCQDLGDTKRRKDKRPCRCITYAV